MNLLIFIPIVIAIVVLIWVFGRRGGPRNGTGDRRDSTERPELTGTEQRKHRL